MKIVVAMDSFKGCLSSPEAGQAAREGILRAGFGDEVLVRPLADGGEGTLETLAQGLGGRVETVRVCGPLGSPVNARYAVLPGGTAVIETAQAAGLPLVQPGARDPLHATTFGVGELIRHAVRGGCRRFLLGLGGSATNDGGAGMLQALGFSLLDESGRPVARGAAGLRDLASLSAEGALPELRDCTFRAACDVTNPLCGPLGCSAVFGPQKGASPEQIRAWDGWLARYAALACRAFPGADPEAPGAGAAGGLGFAILAFLGGSLEPGAPLLLRETGMADALRGAGLAITGEGRFDGQTAMGKAPAAFASLAESLSVPAVALAGSCAPDARPCGGVRAFFPILREPCSLETAMRPDVAARSLAGAAEQVRRLWHAACGR